MYISYKLCGRSNMTAKPFTNEKAMDNNSCNLGEDGNIISLEVYNPWEHSFLSLKRNLYMNQ